MCNQSTHYLDTSSLRFLGAKLCSVCSKQPCFASALALLELLNGIRSEEQFSVRASCIKAILSSGIDIDWTLPEQRLVTSFARLSFEDRRIEPLKQLVNCIARANSLEEFLLFITEEALIEQMEQFEEDDSHFGDQLRRATLASSIRGAFDESAKNHYPGLGQKARKRLFPLFCGAMKGPLSPINISATVLAYAQRYAEDCNQDITEVDIRDLYESYNGSADIFFSAYSYAAVTYEEKGLSVGKNDALDLHHFVYLTHGDVLVTEESANKIIRRVADGIGLRAMSAKQLLGY